MRRHKLYKMGKRINPVRVFANTEDSHIQCRISGDVFCSGVVKCSGDIDGNVNAQKVELSYAHVSGDIICKEIVTDEHSIVEGSVKAESGSVNCEIKGSIMIAESAGNRR